MKRFLLAIFASVFFLLTLGSIDSDLEKRILDEQRIETEIKNIEKRKAFIEPEVKEIALTETKKKIKRVPRKKIAAEQETRATKSQEIENKNSENKNVQAAVEDSKVIGATNPVFKRPTPTHRKSSPAPMKPSPPPVREPPPKTPSSSSKTFSLPKSRVAPPKAKATSPKATERKTAPSSTSRPGIDRAPAREQLKQKGYKDPFQGRRAPTTKLRGLIFCRDLDKIVPDPSIYPPGIILKDMYIQKEDVFKARMKKFLGREITTDLLLQIKEAVVRHYWNIGGPLIRVFVPANQDISSGEIQFYIRHSVLGLLNVNAGQNTPEKNIKDEISVKPGDEIFTGDLLDDKDWLENDPFRSVEIVYEPGELLGTTDIIIGVEEKRPLHCYAGMEISSYKTASSKRWKVGFSKGHLFKQPNHQLNAEVNISPYVKSWNSITANYLLALPKRQRFTLFMSYVRTKPKWWEINMAPYLTARGLSYAVGTRYEFRLPHFGFYFHLLQFGYDFKRSNSYVDYLGTIFGRSIDVSQFLIRYEGAMKQARGSFNFGFSLYLSPGRMTIFNHNKQYDRNRSGAQCKYMYGIFNMDHFVHFPIKATWITNVILQATGSRLIGIEELALGGKLTVRGYAEGEAVGDFGLLVKNELRTDSFRLVRALKDSLQMLIFLDFGYVNDINQSILDKQSIVLLSTGPGFRYIASSWLNFRFDLGFQIKPVHGKLFGRPMRKHGHMGAYLTY